MKLTVSRSIVAYWNEIRGMDPAPTRAALKPGPISGLLPDLFILYREKDGTPIFRLAGTRVCALVGRELRQQSFAALFSEDQAHKVRMLVQNVTERLRPLAVTVRPRALDADPVELEMVLLPVLEENHDARVVLGVMAPVNRNATTLLTTLPQLTLEAIEPIPTTGSDDGLDGLIEDETSFMAIVRRLARIGGKNREKTII